LRAAAAAAGGGPGRVGAAEPQLVQVGGGEVGGHGLDQLPADQNMDAVLVGPHVREPAGALGAHLDPLHPRQHRQQAAGGDHGVELHRVGADRNDHRRRRPGGRGDRTSFELVWCSARYRRRRRLPGGGVVGSEQAGGHRHVQRLVRPDRVVRLDPGVDRGLRRGQVRERTGLIQQLAAHGPMQPLHLPGRGG